MKKCTILILLFTFILSGCASSGQGQAPSALSFTWNDVQIALGGEAAPVIAVLGQPQSYTEEASCAFEGLDKTYFYGSFYLTTCPIDGEDFIYSVWFADSAAKTEEGLSLGAPQSEVDRLYGADSFDGVNAYVVSAEQAKLTILIESGNVSGIRYEMVL